MVDLPARCLLGHPTNTRQVHTEDTLPRPGSPFPHLSPLFAAHCSRPWRRVRSESRRRLIWRCSGKWLACPRIGNASIATSAARPMSTWQWALSSVPPAPGSCKLIFTRHSHVCRQHSDRRTSPRRRRCSRVPVLAPLTWHSVPLAA